MSIAARIDEEDLEILQKLIKEGKYESLSEIVRAAIKEFIIRNDISPWKTRDELRTYLQTKVRTKGIDDVREDEDRL